MTNQLVKFVFVFFVFFFLNVSTHLTTQAAVFSFALDNLDGTFTYNYTIDNTAGAFDIDSWSLEFDVNPDWNQTDTSGGGDVTVPNADWFANTGTPTLGISAQDFFSLDTVATGDTLAGFSFTSSFAPGNVTFFEFNSGGDSASGITTGPVAAVPEPRNWILFGTMVVLSIAWYRKNSSRLTGSP